MTEADRLKLQSSLLKRLVEDDEALADAMERALGSREEQAARIEKLIAKCGPINLDAATNESFARGYQWNQSSVGYTVTSEEIERQMEPPRQSRIWRALRSFEINITPFIWHWPWYETEFGDTRVIFGPVDISWWRP